MKTVNVFVCIQMDIPNQDEDQVSEVCRVLDAINNQIEDNFAGSKPQIFVSEVDASNIVNVTPEFEIGDSVEVPDPDETDIHNHSFVGTIIDFRNGNAVVEDGDGECFEIEVERLTLA